MSKLNWLPGDVFFVLHRDNVISRLIAWFTGGKFGHMGLILEMTEARTYTMETTDFEVVPNILERYLTDPNVSIEVWRHPTITLTERLEIAHQASLLDERVYGYLQLLSMAVRNSLRKIGIKINNFVHIGTICCFVPLYAYKNGSSLPMMNAIDPEQLDTAEARDLVIAQGFERVFEKP